MDKAQLRLAVIDAGCSCDAMHGYRCALHNALDAYDRATAPVKAIRVESGAMGSHTTAVPGVCVNCNNSRLGPKDPWGKQQPCSLCGGLERGDKIEFLNLTKANNGEWVVEYSLNNGVPDMMWITPLQALLIKSAIRAGRNEVRKEINKALKIERLDGVNPV